MTVTMEMLGWNAELAAAFAALEHPEWYPARIIRETKINFTVIAKGKGDHEVVLSGKVWHDAVSDADLPTVGDWVAVDPGQGKDLPVYTFEKEGMDNAPTFCCKVKALGFYGEGKGGTKRAAQQLAAKELLEKLQTKDRKKTAKQKGKE